MLLARATGTFSARSARVRSTLWRGERGARGRHTLGRGEHLRLLAKQAAGCSFFVTQIIYDVNAAKNLVSDDHYECAARDVKPAPIVFTFSVCGSLKTLEFVQWLGVDVPRWIENDLRHADGPPQEAVNKIQSSGYTDKQANVIAASAVLAFCPDMDVDANKGKPSSS